MLMEAGLLDCLTDMAQDSCKFTFNNIIFIESGKISTCRRIVYGSLGAVSL